MRIALIAVSLMLTACTIEQTPSEYIDRQQPAEAEQQAVRAELEDRLLLTASALQRASDQAFVAALAPMPEAVVIDGVRGGRIVGPAQIVERLRELVGGGAVRMEQPEVIVDAATRIAWFRAAYQRFDADGVPETIDFTGVFGRREGVWRLLQGHLSDRAAPETDQEPSG